MLSTVDKNTKVNSNLYCTVVEPVRKPSYIDAVIVILLFTAIVGLFTWIFIIMLDGANTSGNTPEVIVFSPNNNPITNNAGASSNGFFQNGNNAKIVSDIVSCQSNLTSTWSANKCNCSVPFYNGKCDFETHDIRYKAIGNPDMSADIITPPNLTMSNINRLSFDFAATPDLQSKCTKICDNDEECTGVSWLTGSGVRREDNTCIVHKGSIIVRKGRNIPYSASIMPTLYLKGRGNPKFSDRAFVYAGSRQLRYWLIESYFKGGQSQQQTMFKNTVYKLNFTPVKLINDPNFIGIFCNSSFTLQMIDGIIGSSSVLDSSKVINNNAFKNKLVSRNINPAPTNSDFFTDILSDKSKCELELSDPFIYNNMDCYIYCPGDKFQIPRDWKSEKLYGVFTDWIYNNS